MNEAEIQAWTAFARDLKKRVRWEGERIERALGRALAVLPGLEEPERTALLKIGQTVGARSSKLAGTFLRIAPDVLAAIEPPHRNVFLRWAAVFADESRETLIDFLEKAPELLNGLPADDRGRYFDLGLELAREDGAASYKFFLHLPLIQRDVPAHGLAAWFREGLALVRKKRPAALAYFALESRFSQDKVEENHTAVSLEEVARPLKLFAQAVTGKPLVLRPLKEVVKGFSQLLPCTDGEAIFLPEALRDFPSAVLNHSAYKLATAHQAGYVEFGTFQFTLAAVADLFPPDLVKACLQGISAKGKPVPPLEAFFQLFSKKELARDIFHLLEGSRVDHCLRREYRGLRREMDEILRMALAGRPAAHSLPLQEAVLETLLQMAVVGEAAIVPPWPLSLYMGDLAAILEPLLRPGATVRDAARTTVHLYNWLSGVPNFMLPLMHLQPRSEAWAHLIRLPSSVEGADPAPRKIEGQEPYSSPAPLPHRGQLRPELVQNKMRIREIQNALDRMEMGVPLSPEVLQELLEKGLLEVKVVEGEGSDGSQGLFVTDLKGLEKKPAPARQAFERARQELESEMGSLLKEMGNDAHVFYYDEWDYQIGDYRVKWCRLKEEAVKPGSAEFVARTVELYADLIAEVRRQFQMLKPERLKKIPHLERGEEFDLNAIIEAAIDRRAGLSPSEKIYIEKNRKDRDFSTLFLLDMSASTDERLNGKGHPAPSGPAEKRIIDIEKEALVVMIEALEEIGDEYAVFGFSGYGRKEVEFYTIKDFPEEYSEEIQGRIEGIKPQRSTRMGPAIRHALQKISLRESKVKNIILISDGYPQDYDYGEDRSGREYALKDTTMALEEAARKNVHTFCITVDRAGHDYLRKMCPPSRYLVIEETSALPRELPKIYRQLTS